MRPTTAITHNVIKLGVALRPEVRFEHPRDVVADRDLSISEKRAILASWASDATAPISCPQLRALSTLAAPVHIDEIMDALRALDDGPQHPPGGKPMRVRSVG